MMGLTQKLTVIALDEDNNPVPDAIVEVNATGNAVVTQPNAVTNSQGVATATLTDSVAETVTVSATIDGAQISNTFNIRLADTVIDMPHGYWAFDDNYGTIAYDQGLGAHDGALVGTMAWASGRYYDTTLFPTDYALQFNGTNTYDKRDGCIRPNSLYHCHVGEAHCN